LIAFELENWISGSLEAAMQTSEILHMPSITFLANKVLERSALVARHAQFGIQQSDEAFIEQTPVAVDAELAIVPVLPQLPLPGLETTLDLYLEAVAPFCSPEDLAATQSAVPEFLEPKGLGRELQLRLVQRSADPETDAWRFDLYTSLST
jgi:Choline/Carnitine o-acyltransferase